MNAMADPIVTNPAPTVDETNQQLDQTLSGAQSAVGAIPAAPSVNFLPPTEAEKIAAGADIKAAESYMTPGTSDTSVASQLNTLLSSDSEYMKQAAAKSKLTANELGMLSSDRFVGAAQGAAIREGLPIATADAATATKFGLQQQAAENELAKTSLDLLGSGALKTQELKINEQLKKTSAQIDLIMSNANFKNQADMAGLNTKLNTEAQSQLKILDSKLNADLMAVEYDEKTAENLRAQAVSQIENTMISIENILKSPDLLQLGPTAVSRIVNNEIHMLRGGIELSYNIAKLNMDNYVSNLLANYEYNFRFTGY